MDQASHGSPPLLSTHLDLLMAPLLVKGADMYHIPWTAMDMEGLMGRMPSILKGACKWIGAFEGKTIGHLLVVGDMKALLGRMLGLGTTEEVLRDTSMHIAVGTQINDGDLLYMHRNPLCNHLRQQ